ncbi:MAG TPA: enolase C-terminal domain-like protein [Usitatibacter sp.]|nr:enolase C-terminal domain-like protein [Usitatibacter sp.]
MRAQAPITAVHAAAFTIPTDAPESDGTLEWSATTLVIARVRAAGREGIGYTYADTAAAELIRGKLAGVLVGCDAWATGARWIDMTRAVRNLGRAGICAMAISALDIALWDLKGKLTGLPLAAMLGASRDAIMAYGSGGFTSYSTTRLRDQLAGWATAGFRAVKMKVGRERGQDAARVAEARKAIGPQVELFVDANGAYTEAQALEMAVRFREQSVTYFEEPVSSDHLESLRLLRERRPAGMAVAAGEYGYDLFYFRRMLAAGAVDVIQADATRCGGVTGFMMAAAVAESFGVPLSSHCAPSLHAPLCCAAHGAAHLEWFHDHARIEGALFEGAPRPHEGLLAPDRARPGLGLELREHEAERLCA